MLSSLQFVESLNREPLLFGRLEGRRYRPMTSVKPHCLWSNALQTSNGRKAVAVISSNQTTTYNLSTSDPNLTVDAGVSVSTGASDAIDGGSGTAWTVNNAGTVSSSQHYGIALRGTGSSINNSGSISGYGGSAGYGVELDAGGTLTNTSAGFITGGEDAIIVNGAAGTINNSGRIISTFDDGIGLFAGGSVVNNAGAVIQVPTSGGYGPAGIYIPAGSASVVNHGAISGQYGVYYGVAGTVENSGTISGTSYAVDFAVSNSANRLIVDPGAVFNGAVSGGGGAMELAEGAETGTLGGAIGGSSQGFMNFSKLVVDSGAFWTLSGALQVATVQLSGSLEVALDTTSSPISFVGSGLLIIDNVASFAGPTLANFRAGDAIEVHNFSATGATISYNASTGVATISNGAQTATLDFNASTLGAGGLQVASDGGTGVDITLGSTPTPTAWTTTHSATSVGGEVYLLYEAILGRAPDPLGFAYYACDVKDGASLASVATSMLNSSEFQSAHGNFNNTQLLDVLYQDALGRAPDQGGLQFYSNLLSNGISPGIVAADIAESPEAQHYESAAFTAGVSVPDETVSEVAHLYYAVLGRAPDMGRLQFYDTAVNNGASLQAIADDMLNSTEFSNAHGSQTDGQFVTMLYQDALGRAPDAGGFAFYTNSLAGGASRALIAVDVAESPEAASYLAPKIEGGLRFA